MVVGDKCVIVIDFGVDGGWDVDRFVFEKYGIVLDWLDIVLVINCV